MRIFFSTLLAFLIVPCTLSFGQKLGKFNSESISKSIAGKKIKLPYLDMNSYFGYVVPGEAPDEIRDGKGYYYLYIWIPLAIPEIGVRMVSPVPSKIKPSKKDFVAAAFNDNKNERKKYFDTWISLEKASNVISAEQAVKNFDSLSWNRIQYNDDSSELPAQPSGRKYNSLLRKVSDINNPSNALTLGLYRIGFTTYKRGQVEGSFLAQIGTAIKIPGVKIVDDINKLLD